MNVEEQRIDKEKKPKRALSSMQIAVIVVSTLIFSCCAAFGAYLIVQNILHKRLLETYPTAYTEWIKAYADEYGLDPYLVTSIMRCESSNDPSAVSGAGAIGLMQIMPDTGTWIAHKLGLDDVYDESMLYDPETNIRFGCWYLNFLSGRFDGNSMLMIAAYNAGHRAVENWLEDDRFSTDGVLTVIPYEDTERYYERVTKAYENYTALYPDLYGAQDDDAVAES